MVSWKMIEIYGRCSTSFCLLLNRSTADLRLEKGLDFWCAKGATWATENILIGGFNMCQPIWNHVTLANIIRFSFETTNQLHLHHTSLKVIKPWRCGCCWDRSCHSRDVMDFNCHTCLQMSSGHGIQMKPWWNHETTTRADDEIAMKLEFRFSWWNHETTSHYSH